jgi:hypothetical protein
MTASLTVAYALVEEKVPSQPAHQVPRYFAPVELPAETVQETPVVAKWPLGPPNKPVVVAGTPRK